MEIVPTAAVAPAVPASSRTSGGVAVARTSSRSSTVAKPTPAPIGIPPEDDGLGAMYELAEQGNTTTAPDVPHCPSCRSAMEDQAVLCTNCGYDTRTGASLATTKEAPTLGYATPAGNGSQATKNKRTFAEKLIAQWPGALGLLFIAAGFGFIWLAYAYPPHILSIKLVAALFASGMASIGYWSFGNTNSDYKF